MTISSYICTIYTWIKFCNTRHTPDFGVIPYQAPEAMTSEYNHLVDIYSLSINGAQIFEFNTNDIKNGMYVLFMDIDIHVQRLIPDQVPSYYVKLRSLIIGLTACFTISG